MFVDPTRPLPDLLRQRADEIGDRPYMQDVDGTSLTYAEADLGLRRWAAALQKLGVSTGDRVVTMLPNCPDALLTWVGTAALRAIDCGLNNEYRGRMLSYVIGNTAAQVAVIHPRFLERVLDAVPTDTRLHTIVVPGLDAPRQERNVQILPADEALDVAPLPPGDPLASWDIAYLIYTSGTTGASKGVLTPWAQLHSQAVASLPPEDAADDEAYYCPFPLAHGGGRMPAYLMALYGGRLVIRERFSGSEFWDDVRRFRCTATGLVGSMQNFLFSQPESPADADNPLRSVLMLPLLPNHRDFARRFDVRLRTVFSSSEISVPIVSGWDPADHLSCGQLRPGFPGTDVRLVDDNDQEVPVGETGELIVRTDVPWTMTPGYFDMPEATARLWRNGWLHTGDGFRRDEAGNYFFVDRIKDAIRRRGENISSFEVEAHVNEHADVLESAAIAVASEWGEDEVKIVVVRVPGSALTERELVEFLIPRMPRFMVPRFVEFVDELPKTDATMRVRKVVLREAGVSPQTWDREQEGVTVPL